MKPDHSTAIASPTEAADAAVRLFVDQAPAAIAMFDREMRYLAASRRWLAECGLEGVPVEGRRHLDVLPDWPLPWPHYHEKCLLGLPSSREEDAVLRPDGRLDWFRWSMHPWYDHRGELGGSVMFAEVVTGRRQAEENERRLMGERASRGQVLDILESISDAFFAVDRDWRFTFVNRVAEEMLRHGQHDLVGRQLWAEFPEALAHPLHGELIRAFDDQIPFSTEVFHPPSDRWFEVRAFPSRESLSIYLRDVTARRQAAEGEIRLQETLRRNERMSAMGSLVAGVAHQVRNPLFGITLALDALQLRLAERSDLARYFATLEEEVRRVSAVMQDLLDFGKPATVARHPGSVGHVVAGVVERLRPHAEAAGVKLELDTAPDLPSTSLDLHRIPHVFQNLIDNAIQHSAPGTTVRISVRPVLAGSERRIRCDVSDQGDGFRTDDLARVFEPFYTRREGGTGLGLAIVQRIVDEHGGRVWAGNQEGGGGVVTVDLPVIEA